MMVHSTAATATRPHLRAALACLLAYPLFATITHLVETMALHPIDSALTLGLLNIDAATILVCWVIGDLRTVIFSATVLMSATALTIALLLIGG